MTATVTKVLAERINSGAAPGDVVDAEAYSDEECGSFTRGNKPARLDLPARPHKRANSPAMPLWAKEKNMENIKKLIDGVTVNMGGKDWIVPALSFKQLRELLPKIQSLDQNDKDSMVDEKHTMIVTELVKAALSRNYPDVTIEDVENMLDIRNSSILMLAIMGKGNAVAPQVGAA